MAMMLDYANYDYHRINFLAALSLYWVSVNLFMIGANFFLIKGPDIKTLSRQKSRRKAVSEECTAAGRNVDEAVQSGLQELGLTKDKVEIIIIVEGNKGFSAFSAKACDRKAG